MRVLITGRGTSGSWQVRGEQLGAAIGATVAANASQHVIDAHDLVIVVKRAKPDLLYRLRGKPIIYDILDSWPQPIGNAWGRSDALRWLDEQVGKVAPRLVVGATKQMAVDFGGGFSLPHHHRPDIAVNPIRERVQIVGYEGSEAHLGRWGKYLEVECAHRGWRFVMNPHRLADVDIVVALRDVQGYASRSWKSNVKLANAQGAGTPCVLSPEQGYLETASGAEQWADTQMDVSVAFDRLEPHAVRLEASRKLLAKAPKLEDVAKVYREWLGSLALSIR